MSDVTLTDDLRRSVALAELRKAIKDADDLASGKVTPPGLSEEARLRHALADLTWASVRALGAFGFAWRQEDRPASWDELKAELRAERPAIERAEMRATLKVLEGGKHNG